MQPKLLGPPVRRAGGRDGHADLLLTAYAVSLGYRLVVGEFRDDGMPVGRLDFTLASQGVTVWHTPDGWVAMRRLQARVIAHQIFKRGPGVDELWLLKTALDAGVSLTISPVTEPA